jgi:hypothetical protein
VTLIVSCRRRSQRRSSRRTRAEGLVEEQDAGLHGQGAGQGHALPLAAGEGGRQSVGQPVELHELEQLEHLAPDLRFRRARRAGAHAQAEGHVLEHRHVAEERVVLEHEADAAVARVAHRRVFPFEEDLPPVRALEAGDDAQEARLAGAGRPEQGHELAGGNGDAHVVDGQEGAEGLHDVADFNRHAGPPYGV